MMTTPTITTKPCGRCGGTGRYSFNLMDADLCYGCGGTGVVPMTPKGQKKIKPTAELRTAVVGDIVMHSKVLYRVERIIWIKSIHRGFEFYNQKAVVVRLVDDKKFALYRMATKESGGALSTIFNADGTKSYRFGAMSFDPTHDMIGQDADATHISMTAEERAEAIASWVARDGYTIEQFEEA